MLEAEEKTHCARHVSLLSGTRGTITVYQIYNNSRVFLSCVLSILETEATAHFSYDSEKN